MRAVQSVVMVAMLVTLAACGTISIGSPVPASGGAPTASSPTTPLLPPRQRDLDLTGADPCDVMTYDQLHQLAYDLGYERKPLPTDVVIDNGRACSYSSSAPLDQPRRNIGSLVIISMSAGAEAWLTDPNRSAAAKLSRQTAVGGFTALVLPHPLIVDHCGVVVDVHDRQYLEVDSTSLGLDRGTSPDPYCAEAQRVAEMAIQTLSAGK